MRWTALVLIASMMFFGYMFVDVMSPIQALIENQRGWTPDIFGTYAASEYILNVCGFLIVAGKDQTIATTSAGGRGFTAIIVAWLAKFNTFYMALMSFLLIFLQKGAGEIASAYHLNDYASDIIAGIILFFILGSEFFINYRVILRGKKEGEAK